MKTYIVLIKISDAGPCARKACVSIENHTFESQVGKPISANSVRSYVCDLLKTSNNAEFDVSDIEIEPLSDFMDRVNNEEFNPNDYFMSYVHLKDVELHKSIVGKHVTTSQGLACIIEYDGKAEKYQVCYINDAAVGWLHENQLEFVNERGGLDVNVS